MIRLSVMYPRTPESHFDWDYYLGPHLALAHKLLDSRGLVRIEVDKGIGGFPPGTAAPYHAVGHLFFRNLEEMIAAVAPAAEQFMADERKYSSERSVVQISEAVELHEA
jgi:uncharacterized protein (TIGR02118 family)